MTLGAQNVLLCAVKLFLPLALVAVSTGLSACAHIVTLENRLDLWAPEPVNGPYTRMLHSGIQQTTTTTVVTKTQTDYKDVVQ